MRRRDFFKTVPGMAALSRPAAAAPWALPKDAEAAATERIKISDVRLVKIKLVKDKGQVPRRAGENSRGGGLPIQIGGFTMTEVHTDSGLVGLGPGIPAENLPNVKRLLVGKDPFDINAHAAALYAPERVWGAPVEVALWDLLGKATNQPLYKLWGGGRDRVLPYAAMWGIGTPQDRAEIAGRLKAEGWRAIKLRGGFDTLRDDVKVVELVRKAVGDDFHVLVDGNKAPGDANANGDDPTLWTFKRAVDTAMEYQRLNVYWLEEPLPRYAWDLLGELNRLISMPMAGGEANWGVHEFKEMLDHGCFDIVMPEITRLGPQMSRTVGMLASAYNQRCSPHGASNERRFANITAIHLTASMPNVPIVEFIHEPPIGDIFEGWSVFENAPSLDKDGYMKVPQGAGLGISIKPELIEK
jgi:D-galactarolactone cycloisomerase